MSREYRQHYVDKISEEATVFLAAVDWPTAAAAQLGMLAFLKRRTKHYGIQGRYLPPDFKRTITDDSATDGTERETNSAV